MFVGDRERERAAVALREHYARGRLTFEELSVRTGRVIEARSQWDLRRALWGLPFGASGGDLGERGRGMAQSFVRAIALVAFTGAYFVFSFVLVLVFALVSLVHGASTSMSVAFLLAWLVPTYLLVRLWHRRPHAGTARRERLQ